MSDIKINSTTIAAFVAGGIGIITGAFITKKIYDKKIDETAKEAALKLVQDETVQAVVREVAMNVGSTLPEEKIDSAVNLAAKTAAEMKIPEAVKSAVDEYGINEIKKKVDNAVTDYDVRRNLTNAVSEAADKYIADHGSSIVTSAVTKSISERTKALGDIAHLANGLKGL